ncbi:MAG: SIS domain-containing protein [Nostocoides sp.]
MSASKDAGAQPQEDFLYPFLEAQETDADALLDDLAASARSKAAESAALRAATLATYADTIAELGADMAQRFAAGGRLFTFGNGGSSTDAETLAALFAQPVSGRALPAWSLTADMAILTALGNDIGFEVVFARQLEARARENDMAIAMSTSGSSADLLRGLAWARRRGAATIGFAGGTGGQMSTSADVDVCFVVDSVSIHRIQESQALLGYRLFQTVQEHLAAGSSTATSAPQLDTPLHPTNAALATPGPGKGTS